MAKKQNILQGQTSFCHDKQHGFIRSEGECCTYQNYIYKICHHWVCFSWRTVVLSRTSSHIWGKWNSPMFLLTDGSLSLMYMASLMVLVMLCASLLTMENVIHTCVMTCGVSKIVDRERGQRSLQTPLCIPHHTLVCHPCTCRLLNFSLWCYPCPWEPLGVSFGVCILWYGLWSPFVTNVLDAFT